MKRLLLLAIVLGLAALAGIVVAFGFLWALNFVSPFQPQDDDTLRERLPVAAAYLLWAATAVLVAIAGYRRLLRHS